MRNDPFASVQAATLNHRQVHGCGAYTFEDGPGLARISAQVRPARILELGTALGYTACCLAGGSPTATVDTIEGNADHVRLAREQIDRVGLSHRIRIHFGDFEEVLARLTSSYDLIFFDGFAPSEALLLLLRLKLSSDGTLVCANIGLADRDQQSRITVELENDVRWRAIGSIEQGQTIVVRKT